MDLLATIVGSFLIYLLVALSFSLLMGRVLAVSGSEEER
jgi:hypothetical protein